MHLQMSIIPFNQARDNQQGWIKDWRFINLFFLFDGTMTQLIITCDLFYFNVDTIFT